MRVDSARKTLVSFGIENFKSFHHLDDIEIKPLTVLVGSNSVGKSSILQSLLLMKQTAESDRFKGTLKFEGDWTNLINFQTVISNFEIDKVLEFRFTVEFDTMVIGKSLYSHFFERRSKGSGADKNLPVHAIGRSEITIRFEADSQTHEPKLSEFEISVWADPNVPKAQGWHIAVSNGGNIVRQSNLPNISHIIPNDAVRLKSMKFDKFWPEALVYGNRESKSSSIEEINIPLNFLDPMYVAVEALKGVLTRQIEYLGPLRASPEPFYPVAETPDIGPKGQGTVPYLLRRRVDKVKYSLSPTGDIETGDLLVATNAWLNKMGVTRHLTINPVEPIAYVATIESSSAGTQEVNLAQVGFGISQLLPVIVMGLKAPSNGILLLEQPEIHLHPRLQGELGEFLLSVARLGKTVIVETHSDHLIHRLRRCIAEDTTNQLRGLVQILFVHSGDSTNPSSYIEPLEVNEMGSIVNWPTDFLNEATTETKRILRAGQRRIAQQAS